MKAKVFYQDFFLNSRNLHKEELTLERDKAFEMAVFEFDVDRKESFCNKAWWNLNEDIYVSTKEFQDKVKNQPFDGRHSSMSIGDFVEFEDGQIWMASALGWKTFPPAK